MPNSNLTISDGSPVILYSDGWINSDHGDPEFNEYTNGTYHATNVFGASATIRFNGTGVYLFGAFRGDHEQYRVTLDGFPVLGNGSANPDVFGALLFGQSGLAFGEHEIVLTNDYTTTDPKFLDIDYAIVTIGDGRSDTISMDTSLDDNAANFTYSQGWDNGVNDLSPQYFMQSMHRTNLPGAQANVSFVGDAITLFGATSVNKGNFSVSIDGGSTQVLNAFAPTFRPQEMLYFASGLGGGSHVLTVTNLAPDNATFFDIDRVIVSAYAAPTSTPAASGGLPMGAIIGGAVAGVLVLLSIIGLLAFLLVRQAKRDQRDGPNGKAASIVTPFMEREPSVAPSMRSARSSMRSGVSGFSAGGSSTLVTGEGGGGGSGGSGGGDLESGLGPGGGGGALPPPLYAQVYPGRSSALGMPPALPAAAVLANAARHSYVPQRTSFGVAPPPPPEDRVQRALREKAEMIGWETPADAAALQNPHSPARASVRSSTSSNSSLANPHSPAPPSPVYSLYPPVEPLRPRRSNSSGTSGSGPGSPGPSSRPRERQLTAPPPETEEQMRERQLEEKAARFR